MKSCENCKNYEEIDKTELDELLDIPERLQNMTLAEIVFSYTNIAGLRTYAETLDKILSAKKKAVEIRRLNKERTL